LTTAFLFDIIYTEIKESIAKQMYSVSEIEENLKRGILEMLILKALCDEDLYGYQMADIINMKSCGKINIKEGSLYGPLYRLIDKQCISENKVLIGKRRTRIYFHIEQPGREYLQQLIDVYTRVNEGVSLIIKAGETNNETRQ
jgi:predicted transcriptional regulators